jgi:hypothetical protein
MSRGSTPRRATRAASCSLTALLAVCTVAALATPSSGNVTAGNGSIAIVASAVDAAGRPVGDLTASDLKAQIESGGATITGVSHVGAPTQVIVLVDTSATWARGPQKMLWNAQCVSTLAEHLGGNSNFLVLGFNESISEIYNGPAQAPALEGRLKQMPRKGGSALLEVLKFMGESIAQQGIGDRTVLVVVSDGVDTLSGSSTKDVVRALGVAGVPLYSLIVMDPAWNASNLSKLNARGKLADISKATGGTIHTMGPGEVRDATARIAAMLAGRYRIEIDPGMAIQPETKLTLGARREGVAVYYADHVYRQ